jgi:hypothetical protein
MSLRSELIIEAKTRHSLFLDQPDLVNNCVHKMVKRADSMPSL